MDEEALQKDLAAMEAAGASVEEMTSYAKESGFDISIEQSEPQAKSNKELFVPALKETAKQIYGGVWDFLEQAVNTSPALMEGALRMPEVAATPTTLADVGRDVQKTIRGERLAFEPGITEALKVGRGAMTALGSTPPSLQPASEAFDIFRPPETTQTISEGFRSGYDRPVSETAKVVASLPIAAATGVAEAKALTAIDKITEPLASAFRGMSKENVVAQANKMYAIQQNEAAVASLKTQVKSMDDGLKALNDERSRVLGVIQFAEDDSKFEAVSKAFSTRVDEVLSRKKELEAKIFEINKLDDFAKESRSWLREKAPIVRLFDGWLRNEKTFLEKLSPSGKTMSDTVSRMQQQAGENKIVYGRRVVDILGDISTKKTPEEWKNFRGLYEAGKVQGADDIIVAQKLDILSKHFLEEANKSGILLNDATGLPIGLKNYFPHQLNDEGRHLMFTNPREFYKKVIEKNYRSLSDLADKIRAASPDGKRIVTLNDALDQLEEVMKNPSISTVERIAKREGIDVGKLAAVYDRHIRPNIVREAGFEMKREMNIPEEFIENNPVKAWMRYAEDASNRFAISQYFGSDLGKINAMRDKVLTEASMTGNASNLQSVARDVNSFIDAVVGRQIIDKDFHAANNIIVRDQVNSKLGFIASVPNAFQGGYVATGFFGAQKAVMSQAKAILSILPDSVLHKLPGGSAIIRNKRFIEDVGLSGKSFAKEDAAFANRMWERFSPFPLTEDINYRTVGIAARDWMQEAYSEMRKIGSGENAFKSYAERFRNLGVDAEALISARHATIPDKELRVGAFNAIRKGLFPKLVGDFPEFFRQEKNRSSYLFFHFMAQQPKYWQQTLKIGTPGTLASTVLLASLIGEVPADISYSLRGKERTDNTALRLAENIVFSQPLGWIGYNLGTFGSTILPTVGGPAIGGIGATAHRVYSKSKSDGVAGGAKALFESYLRGDIPRIGPIRPIPFGSDIARIFKAATE